MSDAPRGPCLRLLSRASHYGLVAVFLWSTAATAFKLALESAEPCMVVLTSSVVSLTFLAVWNAAARHRLTFGILLGALPRGFLNPFLYYLVLLEAYDRLPAQVAMVVNYLWPVMLVLMHSAISRRRPPAGSILAISVSFCGVILLALMRPGGGSGPDAAGMLLALASTVIWAGFWLLNRHGQGDAPGSLSLLGGFIWGVLFLFALAAFTGRLEVPDGRSLLFGAWIGMFEMGLTYLVWSRALSLARNPAEVGNLIYLTPFLSLGFISLVLDEPLRLQTLCGLVLVLTGIVIQNRVDSAGAVAERSTDQSP